MNPNIQVNGEDIVAALKQRCLLLIEETAIQEALIAELKRQKAALAAELQKLKPENPPA